MPPLRRRPLRHRFRSASLLLEQDSLWRIRCRAGLRSRSGCLWDRIEEVEVVVIVIVKRLDVYWRAVIRGGKYTNWKANFRKSGNYTRKVAKLHQHIGKKFWAMTSRPTSFERFWWDVKADSSFARQSYLSLKKRESYTSWFLSGKTGIVHQLSRNVEITCWNNECFFLVKFWTTDSIWPYWSPPKS